MHLFKSTIAAVTICLTACTNGAVAATEPLTASFAGEWQSVTAPYTFMHLSLAPTTSEQGQLAGRLTLSGIAAQGIGRFTEGSLVIAFRVGDGDQAMYSGTAQLVAGDRLDVVLDGTDGSSFSVSFERQAAR